ncbi:hypothetical protein DFH29DRAFT_923167 [Suillus ampliporus]|nr:hypothetical protein DFH29DRAFT_923167 [Suillus ampliporus]
MHTPSSSSSSSNPRPILKHQPTTPNYSRVIGSPDRLHGVHFPPSPTLTRTYSAHPPSTYDRSPIVVAPNTCALPERGCPGRTYTLDGERPVSSPSPSKRSQHGIHLHPRAVFNHQSSVSPSKPAGVDDVFQCTPRRGSPIQPPLIPDLSSESDESDDSYNASLKPAPSIPWARTLGEPNVCLMTPPYDHYGYPNSSPNVHATLPFLPYPPPPNDTHKVRRQRQRDRSRERDRGSKYGGYAVGDEAHDKSSYKSFALYGGFSTSALDGPEDSCLGGF